MRVLLSLLIYIAGSISGSYAQHLLIDETFDDGDLKSNPPWEFYDEADRCFRLDSTLFRSPPFSLRVNTQNQRASIETVTGIVHADTPFAIELSVHVSYMGDEAIPLFLKGNALVLFLFCFRMAKFS